MVEFDFGSKFSFTELGNLKRLFTHLIIIFEVILATAYFLWRNWQLVD